MHTVSNLSFKYVAVQSPIFFFPTGRIQPIWLQKLPLVFFTYIFFLLRQPSVSFSFPLTSLSFRGIGVSGFHFLLTCLSLLRVTATPIWLAFRISLFFFFPSPTFPLSFRGSAGLAGSPWTAMTTCRKSVTKPEGLLSREELRWPLQLAALFHLFSWRKTRGQLEEGMRQNG